MSDVLQESAESKKPRGHLDPTDFSQRVVFHTYAPPTDLAPFLEHFWTLSWHDLQEPYYSEQVMHAPFVDLFISKPKSGIQGTFKGKRVYVAKDSGRIIGARFLPGAFHLFWNGDMASLQEQNLPAEQAFPEVNSNLVTQMLAADDHAAIALLLPILRAKLPQKDPYVTLINKVIDTARTDPQQQSVASVATLTGRSERWVQQLFQQYVGIGLKWLLQRNRLLAAAEQIRKTPNPDWTAIAYDLGYSSQQYFITDFKSVTGKTPLQYKKDLATE